MNKFSITSGKGFHITFSNGWTVSVQFGHGNYCDNYDRLNDEQVTLGKEGSSTAECAVWNLDGHLFAHPLFDGNTVGAYMEPAQVLELMNWTASQEDRKAT